MTFTGLAEHELHRLRLERRPLGTVDVDAWSGIFLGGGPFNSSDPPSRKSPVQRRVEADLERLLDVVAARDVPFLGACYGIGTLGTHQGAVVDSTYGEPVGAVGVELSDEGLRDPLFGVLPPRFQAFVGHKEAVTSLPDHAVHLARSDGCPVQGFRVGHHVYATQFHPELDADGLCLRIEVYKHSGYFAPHEADTLKEMARTSTVSAPPLLLARFVELYAQGAAATPA